MFVIADGLSAIWNMACASGAVKQEVDVPVTGFFDRRAMTCIGMHEFGAGECGHSAGVINVRMRVTAHRSTSIILGYCCVSFGRVAHLSVRLAHTYPSHKYFHTSYGGDAFLLVFTLLVSLVHNPPSFVIYTFVIPVHFNKHVVKLHEGCFVIVLNLQMDCVIQYGLFLKPIYSCIFFTENNKHYNET